MRYLLFIGLTAILASCKQDSNNQQSSASVVTKTEIKNDHKENGSSISDTAEKVMIKKAAASNGKINHPNFVNAFAEAIEAEFCMDKYDSVVRCYSMHETMVKSDYMQKIPFTLNFPYKNGFDWDKVKSIPGFDTYWSGKCGFMNEKTNKVVNYYCVNINNEARVWLDSLGKTNTLIATFNDEYYKSESIGASIQQSFILEAMTNLDFDNVDHRAFYWTFHLALSELRGATQKINQ